VYVKLCIFHDLNIPTIVSPHMRTLVNTTRFIYIRGPIHGYLDHPLEGTQIFQKSSK